MNNPPALEMRNIVLSDIVDQPLRSTMIQPGLFARLREIGGHSNARNRPSIHADIRSRDE
jgi:hypothetical protein